MDAYARWLLQCDEMIAAATEGMTTGDFPEIDYREEYALGSSANSVARTARHLIDFPRQRRRHA